MPLLRRQLAAWTTGLVAATVLLAMPTAAQAAPSSPSPVAGTTAAARANFPWTTKQLRARADKIEFDWSLKHFTKARAKSHTGIDAQFDWSADGCSIPSAVPAAAKWKAWFVNPCNRHDFGYRNYGHALALGDNEKTKKKIDEQLFDDMITRCSSISSANEQLECRNAASTIYDAARSFGQFYSAFYAGECPANRFCLFDDVDYGDRRKARKKGVADMKRIDFGDKTSSVKNNTLNPWVLYDDDHYQSRAVCITPGNDVASLKPYHFNDKTSSIKRISGSTCPAGVEVISS